MPDTPDVAAEPADAALLREIGGLCDAPIVLCEEVSDSASYCARCDDIRARLRALADVLEKFTDQDIALLASRVRTMEAVKNHPGWIQEAAMWSALHSKLLALLPPEA